MVLPDLQFVHVMFPGPNDPRWFGGGGEPGLPGGQP